jgi:transposase InsO family protein
MSVARSVADVLRDHVVLELEAASPATMCGTSWWPPSSQLPLSDSHSMMTGKRLTLPNRCYIAGDTRSLARDIGLEPRTTPIESPQSNGMAEAFVRTIKRDYVRVCPRPNAESVMRQLPSWIAHYNEVHPHKALGYRSPREFIAAHGRP